MDEGVAASATELVAIAEVEDLLRRSGAEAEVFTPGERAYAFAKCDPARRLAARLAAKRAAARLLSVSPAEVEVVRGRGGPPRLELSAPARQRLHAIGARRALVSLTHGLTHAAAAVLLLRDE